MLLAAIEFDSRASLLLSFSRNCTVGSPGNEQTTNRNEIHKAEKVQTLTRIRDETKDIFQKKSGGVGTRKNCYFFKKNYV